MVSMGKNVDLCVKPLHDYLIRQFEEVSVFTSIEVSICVLPSDIMYDTVKPLYTDIRYNDKIPFNDSLNRRIS